MTPTAIYQRTDAGRIEIQLKKQGLTQSERLVLIVVDGRVPLVELGEKLKGLESSRIGRAIERLLSKQLIFEVLLPGSSVKVDVVDSVLIDRFLQQDPLDPVTIVSFDADYEYEESGLVNATVCDVTSISQNDGSRVGGEVRSSRQSIHEPVLMASGEPFLGVDFYIPLAKNGSKQAIMSSTHPVKSLFRYGSHLVASLKSEGFRLGSRFHFFQLVWRLLVTVGIALVFLSIGEKISHYFGFT